MSPRAVTRHRRTHLRPTLVRAAVRREDMSADALLRRLQRGIEDLDECLLAAKQKGDFTAVSRLWKELRETIVRVAQASHGLWQPASSSIAIDARKQTLNLNMSELSTDELRALARGFGPPETPSLPHSGPAGSD